MLISRQELGQMIVIRASGYLLDHQREYPLWEPPEKTLRHWLEDLQVGGVILLGASAVEVSMRTKQLQSWSKTPLLIAADIEEGVGQRFPGGTVFPPPMSLGEIATKDEWKAVSYSMQMGMMIAKEALTIGINWLLAPVVDINNNPDNPVINIRSFGDTPELVSKLTKAFIRGAQTLSVLTTAKHFPGHGDTAKDSHLELPVINHSLERLTEVEMLPFRSAISAEVASIMTAHLLIPAWDKDNPATLSPEIINSQLRERLGFKGLIVTDALIMGGITKNNSHSEVAVKAIEAGADILLMPPDPEIALDAIYNALETGRLSVDRVLESLQRIASAKAKLKPSLSSTEEITTQLSRKDYQGLCSVILQSSLRERGNLPLIPQKGESILVVDDWLNCQFLKRNSPAVKVPQSLGYTTRLIDQTTLESLQGSSFVLQVFIRGNPFRGQAGLSSTAQQVYQGLIERKCLQAVVIYGSPYVAQWFQERLSEDTPFIFTYGQDDLAQAIVCQKLFNQSIKNLTTSQFTD